MSLFLALKNSGETARIAIADRATCGVIAGDISKESTALLDRVFE